MTLRHQPWFSATDSKNIQTNVGGERNPIISDYDVSSSNKTFRNQFEKIADGRVQWGNLPSCGRVINHDLPQPTRKTKHILPEEECNKISVYYKVASSTMIFRNRFDISRPREECDELTSYSEVAWSNVFFRNRFEKIQRMLDEECNKTTFC